MTDLDAASKRITAAIGDAIHAGELGDDLAGFVGKWVLAGAFYTNDGATNYD